MLCTNPTIENARPSSGDAFYDQTQIDVLNREQYYIAEDDLKMVSHEKSDAKVSEGIKTSGEISQSDIIHVLINSK